MPNRADPSDVCLRGGRTAFSTRSSTCGGSEYENISEVVAHWPSSARASGRSVSGSVAAGSGWLPEHRSHSCANIPQRHLQNLQASYLSHFSKVTNIASTVPANGDENPYGIVVVPQTEGRLVAGDTLVSNFNNSANLQGLGTTIVEIAPSGSVTTFSQLNGSLPGACPGGVGLTTALTTLPGGWVVVGSLPTSDGTSATAQSGCLIVLNSVGTPRRRPGRAATSTVPGISQRSVDRSAEIFVTNVLNGTVAHNPATSTRGRWSDLISGCKTPGCRHWWDPR